MSSLAGLFESVLMLGCATLALVALTTVALRLPRTYFALVGVVYVASQWRQSVGEAGALALVVPLGSVNVGAMDVLSVVAVVASVVCAMSGTRVKWNKTDRAMAAISVLTVLGVAHWITALGLQAGVNGWRTLIYAVCLYWWARVVLRGPLEKVLIGLGVFTALVQAYGYLSTGFAYGSVAIDGAYFDARPVHAQSALLMVVGLAAVLASPLIGRGWRFALGATLGLGALMSLHRSVWVGLLAALFVWALQLHTNSSSRRTRATRAIPLAFALAVVVAIARLSSDLTSAAQNDSTLLWRVSLWLERLTRERSMAEWLLGGVAVTNDERDLGSFVGTSHNMYIDVLEMLGVVGMILLAVVMIGMWRVSPGSPPWSRSLLAAVFAFGLFYPWPVWAWALFGYLGASSAASRHRASGPGSYPARSFIRVGPQTPTAGSGASRGSAAKGVEA